MAIITTGLLARLMSPGLSSLFGINYAQRPDEWSALFEEHSSKMGYEIDQQLTTMPLAPVRTEGGSTTYADIKQAYSSRYTHVEYSLGFIVTRIEIADNLYFDKGEMRTQGLAYSMANTKNWNAANVFNYAFDTSTEHLGGDGVPMISTSHPTQSGNQSNALAVPSELSEMALEEILIQIADCRDNANKKILIKEKSLLVPSRLLYEATRILKNPQRPGTADRDINAMNLLGSFPDGIRVNNFLSDGDAWFVLTDCPNSLKYFNREPLKFTDDNDFDTDNVKFKAFERYSFGWSDWKGVFGSQGA